MNTRIVVACCLVVFLSMKVWAQDAPPAPPPPPPGINEEEVKKLAKDLEATAAKWDDASKYNGNWKPEAQIDPVMDRRLAAVIYGEQSVPALRAALNNVKLPFPLDVYVINRLLGPLSRATPEVNKAMSQTIETLNKKYEPRLKVFKPIANLTPYKFPVTFNRAQERKIQQQQERKMGDEFEVVRGNQQITWLGRQFYRTLALCNDPQADKRLIDEIERLERQRRAPWKDALDALKVAAPIDKARADAVLKSKLAAMEDTYYVVSKSYASRTKAAIQRDEISTFTDEDIQTGIEITTTMNVFRKAVREPLRPVPTRSVTQPFNLEMRKLPDLNKRLTDARRAKNTEAIAANMEQIAALEALQVAFTRIAGAEMARDQSRDQAGDIIKRAYADGKKFATAKAAGDKEFKRVADAFAQQIFDSVLSAEQKAACTPKPVE